MRSMLCSGLHAAMLLLTVLHVHQTETAVTQPKESVNLGGLNETLPGASFPLYSRGSDCPIAGVPAHCPLPKDCSDVQKLGYLRSGLYTVYVGPLHKPVDVFCDNGWLVFQRRQNGFTNFYRGWDEYASGFGDLYGEFWLGNELIHLITQQTNYRLKVVLETFEDETEFAEYNHFKVAASYEKYKLTISGYTSGAPPGDSLSFANGSKFTTYDQDSDIWTNGNCAVKFSGAWWYTKCHNSNLNGKYMAGPHTTYANGINWKLWKGYYYSLKATAMMIRPV